MDLLTLAIRFLAPNTPHWDIFFCLLSRALARSSLDSPAGSTSPRSFPSTSGCIALTSTLLVIITCRTLVNLWSFSSRPARITSTYITLIDGWPLLEDYQIINFSGDALLLLLAASPLRRPNMAPQCLLVFVGIWDFNDQLHVRFQEVGPVLQLFDSLIFSTLGKTFCAVINDTAGMLWLI